MITEEQWVEIDLDIFEGRGLDAVRKIRGHVASLHEAMMMRLERESLLRQRHPPEKFFYKPGEPEYYS
jgi:hypothetical protein